MGKKWLLPILLMLASLSAAQVIYKNENPKDKIGTHLQQRHRFKADHGMIYLDDQSWWAIYPCPPLIHTFCDQYWSEKLYQVDRRLAPDLTQWDSIDPIDVYWYPFSTSQASTLIKEEQLQSTTHLLHNTALDQYAFAVPVMQRDAGSSYMTYPAKYIDKSFSTLINGDRIKQAMMRAGKASVLLAPPGTGRKTAVKAFAKFKQKDAVIVDLRIPDATFMPYLQQSRRNAIVLFTGIEESKLSLSTLKRQIDLLTKSHGQQCFIAVSASVPAIFANLPIVKLPQPSLSDKLIFFQQEAQGLNIDGQSFTSYLSDLSYSDISHVVQHAQNSSSVVCHRDLFAAFEEKQPLDIEKMIKTYIDIPSEDDIREISKDAIKEYVDQQEEENGFEYTFNDDDNNDLDVEIIKPKNIEHDISDLFLSAQTRTQTTSILKTLAGDVEYADQHVAPAKSLLLTGKLGVGKKTFVEGLAKIAKRRLITVDIEQLAKMSYSGEIPELFDLAKEKRPCILCLDFADIACKDLLNRVPAKIADQIEKINDSKEVFIVVIAQKLSNIDNALGRSLRTGYYLHIDAPDNELKKQIIAHQLLKYGCASDCTEEQLLELTRGYTMGEISDLFITAAQFAAQEDKEAVDLETLKEANKHLQFIIGETVQQKGAVKFAGPSQKKITYADVGGCSAAKEDMQEVISFLKNPKLYAELGVRPPKGILCLGPPGCGKTLLAKAVAGEAGCNFYYCSGADLQGMWVGQNIQLIKEAFEQAKTNAPAILFIDEIDAVGSKRTRVSQAADRGYNNALNQLLVEMDGFDTASGVVVIGATNFPEALDKALLRPGRFDRKITINNPTLKERQEILEIYAKKFTISPDVDFEYLARACIGMSGAELETMINEAGMAAGRSQASSIELKDLQDARDRVLMGRENKSLERAEVDRRGTAYHEAGHTVVGLYLECTKAVDKVTITPRGPALGLTWSVPKGEGVKQYKQQMKGDLAMYLGGYAAEKLFLGDTCSGVSSDLKGANRIARHMVTEYGMSDTMGFLVDSKSTSPETKRLIDIEVQRLLDEAYAEAKQVLEEHRDVVERIVEELMEKEILYREDLDRIMELCASEK